MQMVTDLVIVIVIKYTNVDVRKANSKANAYLSSSSEVYLGYIMC